MSYLEYSVKTTPSGVRKLLYLNWPLVLLAVAVSGVGFLMLFSVAGGAWEVWAAPQFERFLIGMSVMFIAALTPIWFWRSMSVPIWLIGLGLLVLVELVGVTAGGATRWIDLGFMRLQPSELMKIAVVMILAAYYDALPLDKVSHPLYVLFPLLLILIPASLVIVQPDLGTSVLLVFGGVVVMFAAGVHWGYFATAGAAGVGLISAVFLTRGTEFALLKPYQYARIDTLLNPGADPAGAGYNIAQAKIALGSGGWSGRGFMEGTQSRGSFVPEKHTDFIFTIFAEEFGFIGSASLLLAYVLIVALCLVTAMRTSNRFAALVSFGVGVTFFLYFAVNMAMVMGLAPVVGVPLPLVSYGGTSMLVLLGAFGLVQSAHIHRPRARL